jgi:hypothetical protein
MFNKLKSSSHFVSPKALKKSAGQKISQVMKDVEQMETDN